jgi:hypothetical protein
MRLQVVSALYSEHQKGNVFAGVDVTKDRFRQCKKRGMLHVATGGIRLPSVATQSYCKQESFDAFAALTPHFSERCATIDAVQAGILDHVYSKTEALRLAVDAAVTVLRVDQIIM